MESKNKYVKNPLSIIAIFASLSEAIATGVLPFLTIELQKIFIWFVMGFPVMLVLLFFFTLHKKYHALYAPSDYKSDDSFTGLALDFRSQNKTEMLEKKREEISEIEDSQNNDLKSSPVYQSLVNNPKVEYFLAEELALKKLAELYEDRFYKNQVLKLNGNQYQIDGLVNTSEELSIFEIKYFPHLNTPLNGIGRTYSYFEKICQKINKDDYNIITFNIIIVTAIEESEKNELLHKVNEMLAQRSLKINIKIFDLNDLKNEFEL